MRQNEKIDLLHQRFEDERVNIRKELRLENDETLAKALGVFGFVGVLFGVLSFVGVNGLIKSAINDGTLGALEADAQIVLNNMSDTSDQVDLIFGEISDTKNAVNG